MNEIMKTNPPSKLAKKLISLSEADNWEEAKMNGKWNGIIIFLSIAHAFVVPKEYMI